MANPSITSKAIGDNVPFTYDWREELGALGDVVISESHWTVDYGHITIDADGRTSKIDGTTTTCYLQGGRVGENAILNNSILCNKLVDPDSGDKLVKRFVISITEGDYEPGTPPVIILPDGIPNLTDLAAFRGATPGVSVWVDTTPIYPTGTIYHACPAGTYTADGEFVVDGQLVQWVELHHFDGGTGVPLTRVINATAPIRANGAGSANLSADVTLSIDPVDHVTSGAMIPADKEKLDGIEAAVTAKGGWHLAADRFVDGVYNLEDPEELSSFRKRTLYINGSDRVVGYENAFIFTGSNNVLHTITIAETEWQGTGSVDALGHQHIAYVETEIICVQSDSIATRKVHRAIIYKLGTGTNWGIGYDGGSRDSSEDVPSGLTPYTTCNLTLSGTNNGDINLGIEPTGIGDPKSEIIVFVRIRAGGKYA